METPIALLLLLSGVSGLPKVWKIWLPNTNYGNPNNWEQERVPRESDSIIFPADLDLGVNLPGGELSLRQLVLPVNGEVFLPSQGVLRITGGKEAGGEDMRWKRRGAAAWLDPFNWRSLTQEDTSAVPHVERLPCSTDTAVFPPNSSFRVTLPEVAVPVGNIKLGDLELSAERWQDWLNTEPGYRQFIGREEERATAVSVREVPMCEDKGGCVCGQPVTRSPERLMKDVCKYAQKNCTKDILCYSPIRPIGHCCDICGGYLTLRITAPQFDIEKLRKHMDGLMSAGEYQSVSGHVGRTSSTQVQVVLVDRSGKYDEVSVQLAGVLKDTLLKDNFPGVSGVYLHTSGARYLGSRLASATSTMLSTLFAVLIFMGLVYLLFIAYPSETRFAGLLNFREVTHPFRFARYENLDSDGDREALHMGCEAVLDEGSGAISQAFDNPLYGKGKDEPTQAAEMERQATLTNPIYSELQQKKSDEEAPVDTADKEETDSETGAIVDDKLDEIALAEKQG